MKVAFFMSTILEQGGGLEKYLIECAFNLSKNYNLTVDIVTMDEKFTKRLNGILNFYYLSKISSKNIYRENTEEIESRIGKSKYIKISNFKDLKETFKNYDLIYCKNEILEACILKFFIGYKNLPTIIFGVHTPHLYPVTKSLQSKLHNFLYCSVLYNFLCSGIKGFHVSNLESYSILSTQFPTKKVYLVNYPFDINRFKLQEKSVNHELNKTTFQKNIFWFARLTEQKGVEDLLLLIAKINNSSYKEKINWHIAGNGQPKYEAMLTDLKNKFSNVHIYGHVSNNNIPFFLENVDLLISTSKWEVSPFNIMEAQSMGVPVIAYNIPGPQDIIINNVTGILSQNISEFENNIKKFINGDYQFSNIENNFQERFAPNIIYPKLISMFEYFLQK